MITHTKHDPMQFMQMQENCRMNTIRNDYKENNFLRRFLQNLPKKSIPSLFMVEVVRGGRLPKVFVEVFLLVRL
jgi:hypothetical protein